jgi:hypothetical protein
VQNKLCLVALVEMLNITVRFTFLHPLLLDDDAVLSDSPRKLSTLFILFEYRKAESLKIAQHGEIVKFFRLCLIGRVHGHFWKVQVTLHAP